MMENIKKMSNVDNKRRNVNNTVYGNNDNILDFHLIENFEIEGVKLVDHFKELYGKIKVLEDNNKKMVDVIKDLHNENKKLKERVDRYGI